MSHHPAPEPLTPIVTAELEALDAIGDPRADDALLLAREIDDLPRLHYAVDPLALNLMDILFRLRVDAHHIDDDPARWLTARDARRAAIRQRMNGSIR